MIEDLFWESSYPSYLHDDYLTSMQSVKESIFFSKQEDLFNVKNRSPKAKQFKLGILQKGNTLNSLKVQNLNSLPIYVEDQLPNINLFKTKNFELFNYELNLDLIEDSYENSKSLNYLYYLNYKSILNSDLKTTFPLSYTSVLDSFRPGYEEFVINQDNDKVNIDYNFENNYKLSSISTLRSSNPIKLRSTTKNAIVTYNAIQKVFRSRFDEGRANLRIADFANSYSPHPFLTDTRVNYESLLGKNKEAFLISNFYKKSYQNNQNFLYSLINSNNVFFYEIPFLLSTKSDPSRYLWFDWQSR